MMENYEESCNKSEKTEKSEVICQVVNMENPNANALIANEENYNFGAEIKQVGDGIDVASVVVNDNDEIKTINAAEMHENVTSTKTELACAADTVATATKTSTTIIITETASTASDSGISLEKCQSDKCDYDTADDIGEDEADDENEDSPDDEDSQAMYAHNAQSCRNRDDSTADSSDDDETSTSTDSDFSDISGLSDVSGKEWKPVNRKPILWVQKQMHSGRNPRELLSRFLPAGAQSITLGLNDMSLWRLLANMLAEPPRRQKLRHVNTFEDVIQLILNSENIVVLTGAGVSVSCGIPDFRSSDGIYSRLAKDYPNLPDPQAMFDIDYFSRDPRPFYKFAREIYPGQFKPSPCHRFIKLLEEKHILLRNYTQNIDTLEQVAGIKRVIECHGSFSTASCTKCKYKCDADAIRADIFAQRIPVCPLCQPNVHQSVDASEPVSESDLRWIVANGIMKPDIVFFGEGLPEEFHKVMASDKDECDLLIVIGSSLKVRPVALIPSSLPANVPQILINREQLNHLEFDVELLGDSDVIINQICHRLGDDWKQICYDNRVLKESKELEPFVSDIDGDGDDNEDVDGDDDVEMEHDHFKDVVIANTKVDETVKTTNVAACSDSGFESSTSMGQNDLTATTTSPIIRNLDELNEIENIKTSILEFNERSTNKMLSVGSESDFQPFKVRSGQDALMTPPPPVVENESLRHLSIDSTKDSGIQCCDSSNSIVTAGSSSSAEMLAEFNEIACSSSSIAAKANMTTATTNNVLNNYHMQQAGTAADSSISNKSAAHSPAVAKRCNRRTFSSSCSAADLLIDGTYYYHKNSSSYVFPGAQISWYADDDDEDTQDTTNDLDEGNCEDLGHKANESTTDEQHMEKHDEEVSVKCDTNKSATDLKCVNGIKRSTTSRSNYDDLITTDSSPSSAKKFRLESVCENSTVTPTTATAATAILTTTINTNSGCSDEDDDANIINNTTNCTTTSLQEATSSSTSSKTKLSVTTIMEKTLQDI